MDVVKKNPELTEVWEMGSGVYYVHECPHKDRSRNVCVCDESQIS